MDLLVALLLAGHLICMNVSSAGPLVCLWCEWREAQGDGLAGRAGRWLATWSWWLLLLGTLIGLAQGALLWDDQYRELLRLLGRKIFWGGWEWLFSVVFLGVYVLWWRKRPEGSRAARVARSLLALLAGTNLLYHFPPLFTILAGLAVDQVPEPISNAQFRQLMLDPGVLSRTVHVWLASFAFAGFAWIYFATAWARTTETEEDAARLARWGGWLALIPTVTQLVVGLWIVTALNRSQQRLLMGGDLPASLVFIVSILLSLWLMHLAASVALGRASVARQRLTVVVAVVLVVLMCFVERTTRRVPSLGTVSASEGPTGRAGEV